MDAIYQYNQARWEALVQQEALFTRPWLDLTPEKARSRLDRWGYLGDLAGRRVLCLAGGGGQQSAAFALLGAQVSVFDISAGQLERDQQAAAHYGCQVETFQGDMRDLSCFTDASFDLVWQPYSLNFVPDCRLVFSGVARVLKPGGLYHFMAANPYAEGLGTHSWNGKGYTVSEPYLDGALISYPDEAWVYPGAGGVQPRVNPPQEYRQTLSRLINGLAERGFRIEHLLEYAAHAPNPEAEPGSWEHFTYRLPPWLWFWARLAG